MKIRLVAIVAALSTLGLVVTTAPAVQALPTKFQKDLTVAKKINFGTVAKLAVPNCGRSFSINYAKCKFSHVAVTVNSFAFNDYTGWPNDAPTYNLDLKIENFTSQDNGLSVGSLIRCTNAKDQNDFYADGMNPQYISSKTQESGVVVVDFPEDVTPTTCKNPTIWLELNMGTSLSDKKMLSAVKKKKLLAAAYIPIPIESLVD
jgi:hypothetical protein